MHSLPPETAARGLLPLLLGALRNFVRTPYSHFLYT